MRVHEGRCLCVVARVFVCVRALTRRRATQPGTQTFVISYVKTTDEIQHHRLYYQARQLVPEGSGESFTSVHDLLMKKVR